MTKTFEQKIRSGSGLKIPPFSGVPKLGNLTVVAGGLRPFGPSCAFDLTFGPLPAKINHSAIYLLSDDIQNIANLFLSSITGSSNIGH